MSDLGWRADGIQRALAAGGLELEVYRRPGFTGGVAVRRSDVSHGGEGFDIAANPEFDEYFDQFRQPARTSTRTSYTRAADETRHRYIARTRITGVALSGAAKPRTGRDPGPAAPPSLQPGEND